MGALVFGFSPFLEYDENPSDLLARGLNGKRINGAAVTGVTLPVEYSRVGDALMSAIDKAHPTVVLGFGLAAGRSKVTPEKLAVNYLSSKKTDNAGTQMSGERIDPREADAYFTPLPVEGLVDELNKRGVPASLSLSAGTYICNQAMFISIREGRKLGFPAGFVHLPAHTEWVASKGKELPSLPLDTIRQAAEVSLNYALSHAGPTPDV